MFTSATPGPPAGEVDSCPAAQASSISDRHTAKKLRTHQAADMRLRICSPSGSIDVPAGSANLERMRCDGKVCPATVLRDTVLCTIQENADDVKETPSAGIDEGMLMPSSCDGGDNNGDQNVLADSPTDSATSSSSNSGLMMLPEMMSPEHNMLLYRARQHGEARFDMPQSWSTTANQGKAALWRHQLVSWFIESSICETPGTLRAEPFRPETLFIAVSILDRFLCACPVEVRNLQNIGIACLRLACKYEEVELPPRLQAFPEMDTKEQRRELLNLEIKIWKHLNCKAFTPTTFTFLSSILQDTGLLQSESALDTEIAKLAIRYALSALLDYDMMDVSPSKTASAAICLARMGFGRAGWDSALTMLTGHEDTDIQDAVVKLRNCTVRMVSFVEESSDYSIMNSLGLLNAYVATVDLVKETVEDQEESSREIQSGIKRPREEADQE